MSSPWKSAKVKLELASTELHVEPQRAEITCCVSRNVGPPEDTTGVLVQVFKFNAGVKGHCSPRSMKVTVMRLGFARLC